MDIFLQKKLALWADVSSLLLTTHLFGRKGRNIKIQGGGGVELPSCSTSLILSEQGNVLF